jgi:lysophospholipase L1-like esterase
MMPLSTAARLGVVLLSATAMAGCATPGRHREAPIAPGSHYVALGSSFAAGPGITTPADQPRNRCARSIDNHAHLLARVRGLRLTDVTCSGATTAHLLGPWAEIPPQIDAVTPDTALVTITIGGNDVGYITALMAASCSLAAAPPPGFGPRGCPSAPTVTEQTWTGLDQSLRAIVAAIRRKAPAARIVFVDYVTVLPDEGGCAAAPLPAGQADASRATARRLAALTARVAADTHVGLVTASALSLEHSACAADPWVTGFPQAGGPAFVPYHPNASGMAAVAAALERRHEVAGGS